MSYLQNRHTATTWSFSSNLRNINVDVAQGSKMGPLHCNIYINDMLSLYFCGDKILCADDAALYCAFNKQEESESAMQHDTSLLHEWLCRNVLTMNVQKTCYLT